MRALTIVVVILTMLLLFSTLVCGLWIGANGGDASSADFHRTLGIATVISSFIVCILALIAVKKRTRKVSA